MDRAAERAPSKLANQGFDPPQSGLHGARYSYADGYPLQRTGAEGAPPAPRKSRSPEGPRPLPRRYAVDSSTTEYLYVKLLCPSVHTSYSRYSSNANLLPRYPSFKPKRRSPDKEPRPFLIHPIAEKEGVLKNSPLTL